MKDNQLLFLISQPRSGSTLLQKLIGAHSSVYTRSEPWILLSQLYAMKDKSYETPYSHNLWKIGKDDFLKNIDNGNELYIKSIQSLYLNVYGEYLSKYKKDIFLDKTPRYYFIIDELHEVFPMAKYILLVRNPLAVLSSIVKTWVKEDWDKLSAYKYDLVDAVDIIIGNLSNNNVKTVYFEDLLKESKRTLKGIFEYIGIKSENVEDSYYNEEVNWAFGDQMNAHNKKGIDKTSDRKWTEGLDNYQYWRVMNDYIEYIGEKKYTELGYNYTQDRRVLDEALINITSKDIINNTKSFIDLVESTNKTYQNNKLKEIIKENTQDLESQKKNLKEKNMWIEMQSKQVRRQIYEIRKIKEEKYLLVNSKRYRTVEFIINLLKFPNKTFSSFLKLFRDSR
jgi:hypothetical protein